MAEIEKLVHVVMELIESGLEPAVEPDTQPTQSAVNLTVKMLERGLMHLKRACTYGPEMQMAVAGHECLQDMLRHLLSNQTSLYGRLCWHVLVNACSGNKEAQSFVWSQHRDIIMDVLNEPDHEHVELSRMVVYMALFNGLPDPCDSRIIIRMVVRQYKLLLRANSDEERMPEHLQFCLEHFCCRHSDGVALYGELDAEERIALIQFVVDFVRSSYDDDDEDDDDDKDDDKDDKYDEDDKEERTPKVATPMVRHWCEEFKRKSDCVLKTEASYVDAIEPREVYGLMEVISSMSGNANYEKLFVDDSALFLNIGSLLVAIQAHGIQSDVGNMFTPISKLGQMAPTSEESAEIERDLSYDMKSMLVRTIGNLALNNARNKELAREMGILKAVLNCTTMDARNPLIKEWSVLAIRNLCEDCPENQEIVAGLTKVGEAEKADIVKELNLELGSMRIGN